MNFKTAGAAVLLTLRLVSGASAFTTEIEKVGDYLNEERLRQEGTPLQISYVLKQRFYHHPSMFPLVKRLPDGSAIVETRSSRAVDANGKFVAHARKVLSFSEEYQLPYEDRTETVTAYQYNNRWYVESMAKSNARPVSGISSDGQQMIALCDGGTVKRYERDLKSGRAMGSETSKSDKTPPFYDASLMLYTAPSPEHVTSATLDGTLARLDSKKWSAVVDLSVGKMVLEATIRQTGREHRIVNTGVQQAAGLVFPTSSAWISFAGTSPVYEKLFLDLRVRALPQEEIDQKISSFSFPEGTRRIR